MAANDPTTTSPNLDADARLGEGAVRLLEQIVEPVLVALGYELVHLEWHASGRHRRLQVFCDHPDGFNLDDCTRLSPILSSALDAAEADPELPGVAQLLAAPYSLEVSSPGLDRPLSRRSHFHRFVGRRATVRTLAPVEPGSVQKAFHGRIVNVERDPEAPDDDRKGTLELLSDEGPHHLIPLALVRRANLIIESFTPGSRPKG